MPCVSSAFGAWPFHKLANLAVPGVDAALAVGKLLENLPDLWDEADLTDFIYRLKLP